MNDIQLFIGEISRKMQVEEQHLQGTIIISLIPPSFVNTDIFHFQFKNILV